MDFHPRAGYWRRMRNAWFWHDSVSRRQFLRWSGGTTLTAAILAACAGREEAVVAPGAPEEEPGEVMGGTGEVLVGTPENPVEHPILEDNPPIESGLEPEAGPLAVYNWADYIWPRVLKDFAAEYGVDFELTTFYNLEEGVRKLRAGEFNVDIFFPTAENIPKLIAGGLFQPLNHDYLPNLNNMWPDMASPYYDLNAHYTVPYTVYTTGIGWRTDIVDTDIEALDNPWDAFWDEAHRDVTGMYDDHRETIGIGLYRNGIMDINTGDPANVEKAKNSLIEAIGLVNTKFSIDGAYIQLPEGKMGLHHAWNGDLAAAPFYGPRPDPDTGFSRAATPYLRYLWPPKAKFNGGYISNDAMGIPRTSKNPVLAHHFLNFLLSEKSSLKNFSWVLYQPPLNTLDPGALVSDGYIPETLTSTVIQKEDFALGQRPVQLLPEHESTWLQAWSEVLAGG